jgi:hypothetical protein
MTSATETVMTDTVSVMTTRQRTIRIDDELWDAAKDEAARQHTTLTDVVMLALSRFVAEGGAANGATIEMVKELTEGAEELDKLEEKRKKGKATPARKSARTSRTSPGTSAVPPGGAEARVAPETEPVPCTHPKDQRKGGSWGWICSACGHRF